MNKFSCLEKRSILGLAVQPPGVCQLWNWNCTCIHLQPNHAKSSPGKSPFGVRHNWTLAESLFPPVVNIVRPNLKPLGAENTRNTRGWCRNTGLSTRYPHSISLTILSPPGPDSNLCSRYSTATYLEKNHYCAFSKLWCKSGPKNTWDTYNHTNVFITAWK